MMQTVIRMAITQWEEVYKNVPKINGQGNREQLA